MLLFKNPFFLLILRIGELRHELHIVLSNMSHFKKDLFYFKSCACGYPHTGATLQRAEALDSL